jgi:hypothetical protein
LVEQGFGHDIAILPIRLDLLLGEHETVSMVALPCYAGVVSMAILAGGRGELRQKMMSGTFDEPPRRASIVSDGGRLS